MKIRIAALAVVGALALAGCASTADESTPAPTNEVTGTIPSESTLPPAIKATTTTQAPTIEDLFVATVRDNTVGMAGMSDAQIIDLGHTACDVVEAAYSNGNSVIDAMLLLAADPTLSDDDVTDLGFLIGAAIPTYCDQYTGRVSADLGM